MIINDYTIKKIDTWELYEFPKLGPLPNHSNEVFWMIYGKICTGCENEIVSIRNAMTDVFRLM
jgi:hypothetical protein